MLPFRKRPLANSEVSGSNSDPGRSEWVQHFAYSQFTNGLASPEKRRRIADGVKVFLDIVKESSDWFPPLKAALGGVSALIKHYEVLVEWATVVHN